MRNLVSFATAAGSKQQNNRAADQQLDPSSYFHLPTVHSGSSGGFSPRSNHNNTTLLNSDKPSEINTSSTVKIPDEIEQFQKLTPRQRIQLEFKLQHKSSSKQPPSHLFGSTFEREAAKRSEQQSREGFRNEQMKRKLERQEQRQSLRLSRSNLAMSMSLALEKGLEEKVADPKLKRPSPWVKNEYGADRHKFQVNWPDRSGAPLPTIPQKWSAPGPGAYTLDRTFGKYDEKLVRETLRETLAEEEAKKKRSTAGKR